MTETIIRPIDGDAPLVDAAQKGDRDAFGRLYERHARAVHGLLMSRVPPGEVDDLMQDVFIAALDRLTDLRDRSSFGPWLMAIARNRARDYYRRSRETVPFEDEMAPDQASTNDHEAARVLALLRSLPEAYRETLALRLVEGLTGPEIAAQTGLSRGSVRVNLHRGMAMLREKLGVSNA